MKTTFVKILAAWAIAAPIIVSTAVAQTGIGVTWNPGGPDPGNWNVAGNWGGTVPGPGYKAFFNISAVGPAVVSDTEGGCQVSIGDGGNGTVIVTNGGNLDCGDTSTIVTGSQNKDALAWTGLGTGGGTGTMYVAQSGTVTFEYHLWIGLNDSGHGFLYMNGGTATVLGAFRIGSPNAGLGQSQVHMNGGTLNLSQWNDTGSITTGSFMDIAGGTVIINGDHTVSISNYVASGQITANGGPGGGNLNIDFNTTNPGKTTITAKGTTGGGGGCATIDNFNNSTLSGPNGGWATATITSTSSNVQVTANGSAGFGDSYVPISPVVSVSSNLTLSLDVTIGNLGGGVIGTIIVLEDGNQNQLRYTFYNTGAGNHVLTAPLSSGVQAQGSGFNFSTITFIHVQTDPEGVTAQYTIAFNDLSVTGCNSKPQISRISLSGGNVNITVGTTSGTTYHVESTAQFPASWTTVSGTTSNATSASTTFSFNKPAGNMQFYRVATP